MKTAIIIPARLASTRLPRKLLLDVGGAPLIVRTIERARGARRAADVLVATDSEEIASAAAAGGARPVMTRADHQSGTERLAEAMAATDAELIVNVQGDEPEIDPRHIDALIETQIVARAFASTLACPFPAGHDPADPAAVKAILGGPLPGVVDAFRALYFTRARAPFPREGEGDFHLHIGAYAYSRESLARFAAAPPSRLERIEKLEQLRILEMGEAIAVRLVAGAAPGIDTPEDYAALLRRQARA